MRTKKAIINSIINIISFIIIFIPNLIIRRVFLDTLGSDLLGLNSLYANIIGWLSIVEMGIGTAIIFSLYKPFNDDDKEKIRAYIRFYGQFYRVTGIIILILGIIIAPFLKYFIKGHMNLTLVTAGFLIFLVNTVISYLFSNRLCILNVAQEAYKITIGITLSKIITIILQLIMLKRYQSFILFITIQLIINLVYFITINIYVVGKYPWISKGKEKLDKNSTKELIKNIRALFMHKIGAIFVFSTDNLVISKFIGLTVLAKYTNYYIIIAALQGVVDTALNGVTASIGNMLVDKESSYAQDICEKLFFITFWISSFLVISLYNTLNQFIGIWVGQNNLIDKLTFIVIMINLYITTMRGTVNRFKESSGIYYKDRYAPICEAIINIVTSIILVNYIGLAGVFIGTLISNITVIFWTEPYMVYKYVFKEKLREYYKMYFKYLILALIPLVISNYLTIPFRGYYKLSSFIINCLINIVVINLTYLVIFFRNKQFKYYYNILKETVTKLSVKKVDSHI